MARKRSLAGSPRQIVLGGARWLLVDYDCTGLYQIQARDDHPHRDEIDDEAALRIARREARYGDAKAVDAVKAHDRDAEEIERHRTGYGLGARSPN